MVSKETFKIDNEILELSSQTHIRIFECGKSILRRTDCHISFRALQGREGTRKIEIDEKEKEEKKKER